MFNLWFIMRLEWWTRMFQRRSVHSDRLTTLWQFWPLVSSYLFSWCISLSLSFVAARTLFVVFRSFALLHASVVVGSRKERKKTKNKVKTNRFLQMKCNAFTRERAPIHQFNEIKQLNEFPMMSYFPLFFSMHPFGASVCVSMENKMN